MAASNGQSLVAELAEPVPEPSMEDILASIRRIIASDQHIAGARALGAQGKAAPAVVSPVTLPPTEPEAVPPVAAATSPAALAPAYPGDIPNLDDLDPLVLPPAAIEPQADVSVAAVRREASATLHPELFPPPEVRDAVEAPSDIYDLTAADRVPATPDTEDLISTNAREAVSSSFHMLAGSLLRDPDMIERLARESLKPMLRAWLDENLPSLVERLVRAEIERVARGGGRRS